MTDASAEKASSPEPIAPPPREGTRDRSRALVEMAVAGVALLAGLAMMFDSHRIGAGWSEGSLESGYFPLRIGAIICIVSAVLLVRAFVDLRRKDAVFASWQQLRLVLMVLVPTLAYLAAIPWLGIYVASAAFIAAFMHFSRRSHVLKTLCVSVSIAAALFVLFEISFLVPLPKGPIESLLGY